MIHPERLNKLATGIVLWLMDQARQAPDNFAKIDRSGGAFRTIKVEIVRPYKFITGTAIQIVVEENYKQNGDTMADPRMDFLVVDNRMPDKGITDIDFVGVYPSLYVRSYDSIDRELLFQNSDEKWMIAKAWQMDAKIFADQWMRNIMEQQAIKETELYSVAMLTTKTYTK